MGQFCRGFSLGGRMRMLDCPVWLGVHPDKTERLEHSCHLPHATGFPSYHVSSYHVSEFPIQVSHC